VAPDTVRGVTGGDEWTSLTSDSGNA